MPDHESTPDASLLVLGARGSIPVSGPSFLRYGGSTTSFAILDRGTICGFVDAGTGLLGFRSLGFELSGAVSVFLTHYHWDHIQGISMLGEVWAGACLFTIYGPDDPEKNLNGAIRPPWFPVALEDAPEPVEFRSMDGTVERGPVAVSGFPIQHPQGGLGYFLKGPNRSAAVVTDHESAPDCDDLIAEAIDGVDVLIHDAQYLPAEAETYQGWGHSTWVDAVRMAERVGASELVLTSHNPARTDDEIDEMVAEASAAFGNVTAAAPGMEVSL